MLKMGVCDGKERVMITRVTIVAKNDTPVSLLVDNPNEKVKAAWEIMLNLVALRSGETVSVEKAEVWDNEPQTKGSGE